ncbi:hypothetical protein E2C01_062414 [Portunus trituberculatus]|uniref:Uncharacterized protein n=1 Tax=Portunus trituberculatus TaxID=210409 RepID=A0A5B7HG01_PORTR|nr:hypothetical protein [Portunus trituberculatus]
MALAGRLPLLSLSGCITLDSAVRGGGHGGGGGGGGPRRYQGFKGLV